MEILRIISLPNVIPFVRDAGLVKPSFCLRISIMSVIKCRRRCKVQRLLSGEILTVGWKRQPDLHVFEGSKEVFISVSPKSMS